MYLQFLPAKSRSALSTYLGITISSRQIEEAIIFSESISFLPAKILCDVTT